MQVLVIQHPVCSPGVCVQVSLQIHTQMVKIKRSCVVKVDKDPYFNHRMTFKLRSQHLDEACLRFELQQPNDARSGERVNLMCTLSYFSFNSDNFPMQNQQILLNLASL